MLLPFTLAWYSVSRRRTIDSWPELAAIMRAVLPALQTTGSFIIQLQSSKAKLS